MTCIWIVSVALHPNLSGNVWYEIICVLILQNRDWIHFRLFHRLTYTPCRSGVKRNRQMINIKCTYGSNIYCRRRNYSNCYLIRSAAPIGVRYVIPYNMISNSCSAWIKCITRYPISWPRSSGIVSLQRDRTAFYAESVNRCNCRIRIRYNQNYGCCYYRGWSPFTGSTEVPEYSDRRMDCNSSSFEG